MAVTTKPPTVQTSRLLSIPREIRNEIYELAFFASFPDIDGTAPAKKGVYSKNFAITATCHQIRAEAQGLLAGCLTTHKRDCWKTVMTIEEANERVIEDGIMMKERAFDLQFKALAKYFAANHALFYVGDGMRSRGFVEAGKMAEMFEPVDVY